MLLMDSCFYIYLAILHFREFYPYKWNERMEYIENAAYEIKLEFHCHFEDMYLGFNV